MLHALWSVGIARWSARRSSRDFGGKAWRAPAGGEEKGPKRLGGLAFAEEMHTLRARRGAKIKKSLQRALI
jgi:hypothetical protein